MSSMQATHHANTCPLQAPASGRCARLGLTCRHTPASRTRPVRALRVVAASHSEDRNNIADQPADWASALRNCVLGLATAATVLSSSALLPVPVEAKAPSGNPVQNARALLRNSLPIGNKEIREIQTALENVNDELRIPGQKSIGPIQRNVNRAKSLLSANKAKISAAFTSNNKEAGDKALDNLAASLRKFDGVLEAKDKQAVPLAAAEALGFVSDAESALVKEFPFEIPKEYSNLPRLLGRATVQLDVKFKGPRDNGVRGGTLTIVCDGYNAPITAGNFVDLVNRGFYNGMEIQRADGLFVQTGNPGPPAEGFVDEKTGEVRRIPLEIRVVGDRDPVYGETLEDIGRFNDTPQLPFNAFGTIAMARSEFEANSASSQVFLLLKESELTPSGSNLLDGRYAVFGYTVENEDLLTQMQVGDTITSAKVLSGLKNLQA